MAAQVLAPKRHAPDAIPAAVQSPVSSKLCRWQSLGTLSVPEIGSRTGVKSALWQRAQWAAKIGCTSLVYVGTAGTSGLQPRAATTSASANGSASVVFDM